MIINDLDGYYIVFDTKNWNTELDTLYNKSYCKHFVIGDYSLVIKEIPDCLVTASFPAKVINTYDFMKEEWVKVK